MRLVLLFAAAVILVRDPTGKWVKVKNPNAPAVNRRERRIGGVTVRRFPRPPVFRRLGSLLYSRHLGSHL
jgi:hypothetical protein